MTFRSQIEHWVDFHDENLKKKRAEKEKLAEFCKQMDQLFVRNLEEGNFQKTQTLSSGNTEYSMLIEDGTLNYHYIKEWKNMHYGLVLQVNRVEKTDGNNSQYCQGYEILFVR